MTAEEFLKSKQYDWVEDINTTECMIEFSQYHVKKALIAATKNVSIIAHDVHEQYSPYVDESSILNAYPLDLIK